MLTNFDVEKLADQMEIPLAFCGFKDDLPRTLKVNQYYCINLHDEYDEDGQKNDGSHWTGLIVQKSGTGSVEPVYFDSFGAPPPQIVLDRVKANFNQKCPYTKKDIQSLMNDACGWYQLAWAHYCLASDYAHGDLMEDTMDFLDNFIDLNHSCNYKQNEWVLKHFFRAKDPKLRIPVDVLPDKSIIDTENPDPIDKACLMGNGMKIPVEMDYK